MPLKVSSKSASVSSNDKPSRGFKSRSSDKKSDSKIRYNKKYYDIVIDDCDYVVKLSSNVVKTSAGGIVVGRMVDGEFDDTYCGNSDGEYE
jgi:hypothetical protein